jgi:hypothetical protein
MKKNLIHSLALSGLLFLTSCLQGGENPELSSINGFFNGNNGGFPSSFSGVDYVSVTSPTTATVHWSPPAMSTGMGFSIYLYLGGSLEAVYVQSSPGMTSFSFPTSLIPFASYSVSVRQRLNSSGDDDGNNNRYNFVMDPSLQPPRLNFANVNITPFPITDRQGTYFLTSAAGAMISYSLNFSASVNVIGSPRIPLVIDGTTFYAIYSSGSGSSNLTFNLSLSGIVSFNTIFINNRFNGLELNGGTIKHTTNSLDAEIFPRDMSGTIPLFRIYPDQTRIFRVGFGEIPTTIGSEFVVNSIDEFLEIATHRFIPHITGSSVNTPSYFGSGFGPTGKPYIRTKGTSDSYLKNTSSHNITSAIFVLKTPPSLGSDQKLLNRSSAEVIKINTSGDLEFELTSASCSINGSGFSGFSSSCDASLSPNTFYIIAIRFSTPVGGAPSTLLIGKESVFDIAEFIFLESTSMSEATLHRYTDHLSARYGI